MILEDGIKGDSEKPGLVAASLTDGILGAAFEVHSSLGPGLLESVYEECLCHELKLRGIAYKRQVDLPVLYKGVRMEAGFRIDVLVEGAVILELKSVDQLLPIHEAQLLTYLRLSRKRVGFLMNFNSVHLRNGLIRRTR